MSVPPVTKAHVVQVIMEAIEDNFIEYEDFLSNHLSHAAIALLEMKVGKDHFDGYVRYYKKRLESPQGETATRLDQSLDIEEGPSEILGQRKGFYKLKRHYQTNLDDGGSLGNLLRDEFPNVMNGMCGSLLHPIIHIGYGLRLGRSELVVEGLAYAHYSYAAPRWDRRWNFEEFGHGTEAILDVLDEIREDKELFRHMESVKDSKLNILPSRKAGFQSKVLALFDKGDQLMEYIMKIKGPKFEASNDLMNWILNQIITVFVQSEKKNDFVLLHGVTSFWALKQVAQHLRMADLQQSICVLLSGVLAAYIGVGCPRVAKRLEGNFGKLSWNGLREELLAKPFDNVDEHDYKLYQVCYEQSQNQGNDGLDLQEIYKEAVKINIEVGFHF